MAEPQVATAAPESDAQEIQSPAAPGPASTSTPAAPTLSDHCTTDRPTPAGLASTGEITKLGEVDVYISKPAGYPHTPARLLLLLTNGSGHKSINNQIQADRFATEGYVVVMPDLFDDDPAPNANMMSSEPTTPGGLLETFKIKAAETAKSFLIDMWLARHTSEKVMPILTKVIDACRDEFADAVSNGGGIYAVGYCFGGRYILLLASERPAVAPGGGFPWSPVVKPVDEEAGKAPKIGPLIKAGAIAHATLVSRDDFIGLKSPVSVVSVEHDPMFPDDVRTAAEDYMSKNNVEHEVQVYPGVPHGFAVVGEYDNDNIKQAQVTAFEQMLKWIKEH
ncbi:Alpha/Beta hydrolase protein [Lasiosphaeria hispida]|uniref:Alpha/Beta hydrolase protein n=1 Tax=Lasiosphaeria hispida TaxID=260671 RepID=A0AAJ0HS63_9PEZI|nr:Alpha/Beta hydrolase protein [Lasiosphaeria hispida]